MGNSIVILAAESDTTPIVYNSLTALLPVDKVIIEETLPRSIYLRKRIKRLGLYKVVGQILFQLVVPRILKITSQERIKKIKTLFQLSEAGIPKQKIHKVSSVNSKECHELLQEINPQIVIVNGTRIISQETLECINAKFLNIHAGITPKYRGVHGAYWALAENDITNCGVTVHLVDKGIDTGPVLYQERINISKKDNFVTYPYLQLGVGLKLLTRSINDILNGKLSPISVKSESFLWHHPTIWGYLKRRITKKIQ